MKWKKSISLIDMSDMKAGKEGTENYVGFPITIVPFFSQKSMEKERGKVDKAMERFFRIGGL